MFCVTSTATASSLLNSDVKRLIPAFESGKVSNRKLSSWFKKQTTKLVLCKSTPIYLTSLIPPFLSEALDKEKKLSRCISTLLFGIKKSHTVMRVRVLIGHTVSRASSLPKIIADPHPVSCLRPPKSIANIIHRFFCLYHDLLDGGGN